VGGGAFVGTGSSETTTDFDDLCAKKKGRPRAMIRREPGRRDGRRRARAPSCRPRRTTRPGTPLRRRASRVARPISRTRSAPRARARATSTTTSSTSTRDDDAKISSSSPREASRARARTARVRPRRTREASSRARACETRASRERARCALPPRAPLSSAVEDGCREETVFARVEPRDCF